MIKFTRHTLDNGLRIIIHEDHSTPMAAVNIIYNVGSRNESPEKTGYAHLFEHLMFSGSKHAPNFDTPLQLAGGESNAYTNCDLTNYYDVLPADNLETAFWLESDRMLNLDLTEKSLEIQRKVVTEEYKETCLMPPYGQAWHNLMELTFKEHPYRWPVIGRTIEHIEKVKLEDIHSFFNHYYSPSNAVMVVAGAVKHQQVVDLAEKWFSEIPKGVKISTSLPQEPVQQAPNVLHKRKKVPMDALYMAFHMPNRLHPDYYAVDILSDVLCNGNSSRLFRKLKKDQELFADIDCYITGHIDPGLFIIEGKPSQGVSLAQAEAAIWKELNEMKADQIPARELQKLKNKLESSLVFSEATVLNKAINLAFFEILDDAALINREAELYQAVTVEDVLRVANEILRPNNCSTLWYQAEIEAEGATAN